MTKIKAFNKTFEVKQWNLDGSLVLTHPEEGEIHTNIKATYKDFGGKKDVPVFKGEFADKLWGYRIATEAVEAGFSGWENSAQELREKLVNNY